MTAIYPVRVEGRLDPGLSRWMWLVKWLLAIPHYIVLAFLWVAFAVLSVVAFFAILFTGHYPRAIFDFNVGVLRWSWRVAYYAYGALATDRYPPFTLNDVPDYPATLNVAYPEHLSRGLVLVKWWLLAIPHYLVVAFFVGGGTYVVWQSGEAETYPASGGLIGLLVLIAAVVLLFTGRYPRGVFDFVLGMNRWVLRVAAYAGLMTDVYPPFRFDAGGSDQAVVEVPADPDRGDQAVETGPATQRPEQETPGGSSRWTAGRIISVVIGSVLVMAGGGLLTAGAGALWVDQTQRDAAGFLSTDAERFSTTTYAVTSEPFDLQLSGPDWAVSQSTVGDVRLRAAGSDAPLFIGIGPADEVATYLSGVEHDEVTELRAGPLRPTYERQGGAQAPADPAAQDFWVASAGGTGAQSFTWTPEDGRWMIVVMNADASASVDTLLSVGATAPWLDNVAIGLLFAGALVVLAGVVIVLVAVRRAARA